MILENQFDWNLDPQSDKCLRYIGGVDISFVKDNNEDACASLVVLSYPDFNIVYENYKMVKLDIPYIPTFLAFREVGPLIDILNEVKTENPELFPQIILVDGNGILHPRRFGLACHLGVLANIPTIGCSKNPYLLKDVDFSNLKKNFREKTKKAGDYLNIITDKNEIVGCAYKATDEVINPIYISPGHKIDLETSIEVIKRCCKYRIPEPVRLADTLSRKYIRLHYK